MNIFCFNGNICKDIETRTTNNGKEVASFSIAINEGKDKTEFINCVAWEGTARLIKQYCNKGDRLAGTGRISTRKWEDKQGNNRYTTECIVSGIDLPPKAKSYDHSSSTSNNMDSSNKKPEDIFNDEIPF